MSILKIHAREIFDSYGNPTVEVDLFTSKGLFRAAVPSGASTGIYEALVLQDNDKTCYMGMSPRLLSTSIKLLLNLSLVQMGVPLYHHITNLAGNSEVILLVPAFNFINGGSHAGNKLAMQEFMILPVGAANFREAMRIGVEVYHNLKNVIKEKYGKDATNVGDEGGFAPNILENKEVLELLKTAIGKAVYADKVVIGMDFFRSVKYDLDFKSPNDPNRYVSPDQLADLYKSFVKDYPVVSTEDPVDQDDWGAWQKFMASAEIQVVGDNFTVTNPKRIAKVMNKKLCNYLLKMNQIGSLTKSLQACKLAHANRWGVMVSHHSGETEDNFFTNLVTKTGAPCQSKYLAKYNQLLRIEEELGSKPTFASRNFRNPLAK
uniref:phosphopyruvate hydratase n=1 Tax=Aotus nancymaae TaxID=37293 RepID=A0A2K5CDK8_AOTNA